MTALVNRSVTLSPIDINGALSDDICCTRIKETAKGHKRSYLYLHSRNDEAEMFLQEMSRSIHIRIKSK